MDNSQSFHASINIPPSEYGRIVTDRITRTRARHTLEITPENEQAEARTRQYRETMLQVLHELAGGHAIAGDAHQATRLVQNFIKLATTLAESKALAFPLDIMTDTDDSHAAVSPSAESVELAGTGDAGDKFDFIKCESDRPKKPQSPEQEHASPKMSDHEPVDTETTIPLYLLESVTHPLSVALLAYHFGGPVNAAHSARRHAWKYAPSARADVSEFHVEGGADGVLHDVRVTVAWEEQDHAAIRPSGQHDVFLAGDATPFPLVISEPLDNKDRNSPLSIIYNHADTTLYYGCQNPGAVRNSVSLDFHLNTIMADTLQLLPMAPDDQDMEKLTLTRLTTSFPVANYTAHFQRLLYGKDAMMAMLGKLGNLHVPVTLAPPVPDRSEQQMMLRFQNYNNDNVQHIPSTISSEPFDVPLTGVYLSPVSYLDSVCVKACRDIHRPIGHSLFPQSAIDQKREDGRKFVRDLPEELISSQLANYANVLILTCYTSSDLLTTSRLRELATNMEQRCHELIALGFVDHTVDMSSMAALASAFGAAIDGPKEIYVSAEPWVEEADLLMFRTRCLYLFWCVDWFVCYLVNPTEGSFGVIDAQELSGHLVSVRHEMARAARLLLRHWVAWGMFMEGLPQGGFFVRQSLGKSKYVP